MYRRNSVNINELINRFEPTDDDFGMAAENVKYVKITRPKGKMYTVRDEDENSYDDENSLIKYTDKMYNTNNKKRRNATMTNAFEITKHTVALVLSRISGFLEIVSKFPFPRMSVMSFGLTSLLAIFICPRGFTERALYPGFKLVFSIIYPAYRSFKAVRNKNLKEYLKWIVYWIVYAFFTCIELLSDAVLCWLPFYYEIKVISFIWLLGPSSRGSMKVYKKYIHPMLISREQEIDDVIQIAQDRGYMHVFRLGSKSVNYANRIIMQETKAPDNNIIVSHQLMKNIRLSNLSDADNDIDDAARLRKFSMEQTPLCGGQLNYTYEQVMDQRGKASLDYRYGEISSGYSSPPESPSFYHNFPQTRSQAYIEEDDRKMHYLNLLRNSAHSSQSEKGKQPRYFDDANHDVPRRKASINELSEDEIISACNELKHQAEIEVDARAKKEDLLSSSEMKEEFVRWMEMKRREKISNSSVTPSVDKSVKVNAVVDESDVVSVVNSEHEQDTSVNDTVDAINEATSDFDEFKDVILDEEDNDDYLKVSLVIEEECNEFVRQEQVDDTNLGENNEKSQENSHISTVIESKPKVATNTKLSVASEDKNMIVAKITLGNVPLVVTSLSSSTFSLASEKSIDESGYVKKRPARHSKGRAPAAPSVSNEIPGQFYDQVTKKFFKETEL